MHHGLRMGRLFGFELFGWFLVLLKNVPITVEYDYIDMRQPEKQMSLETCLGNMERRRFDVHSNTIIRTGESQAIGGKFLQGLELETPEKCQRLCCETINCDVYVFEEKNGGYCYLFQCGSPRNFHCKFTRHPNYTSALLTQYKPLIPTTPKPISHGYLTNISTQERELISLKLKPEKTIVPTTSAPVKVVTTESRLAAVPVENRNLTCGRFEFPCHSGECIAIYNACNGIPQCVDGSDEGPECANNNVKPGNRLGDVVNHKPDVIQQTQVFRDNSNKFPAIGVDTPFGDNREGSVSAPTVWISQKVQADTQSDMDRTVFGRKSSMNIPAISLEDHIDKPYSIQRGTYEIQPPVLKSSFPTVQVLQPTVHSPNTRWQSEQQAWQSVNPGPGYSVHQQPLVVQSDQHLEHTKDEQSLRDASKAVSENTHTQVKAQGDVKSESKHTDYADYPEKPADHPSKTKMRDEEPQRTAPPAGKAPHMTIAEQYKMIEQHLKFADHDGHSERPRGAILSLTLGLLVTGVIVILIGCRLRTVGRRGGRHGGKGGYAPDEDFLVNGMYL